MYTGPDDPAAECLAAWAEFSRSARRYRNVGFLLTLPLLIFTTGFLGWPGLLFAIGASLTAFGTGFAAAITKIGTEIINRVRGGAG